MTNPCLERRRWAKGERDGEGGVRKSESGHFFKGYEVNQILNQSNDHLFYYLFSFFLLSFRYFLCYISSVYRTATLNLTDAQMFCWFQNVLCIYLSTYIHRSLYSSERKRNIVLCILHLFLYHIICMNHHKMCFSLLQLLIYITLFFHFHLISYLIQRLNIHLASVWFLPALLPG